MERWKIDNRTEDQRYLMIDKERGVVAHVFAEDLATRIARLPELEEAARNVCRTTDPDSGVGAWTVAVKQLHAALGEEENDE